MMSSFREFLEEVHQELKKEQDKKEVITQFPKYRCIYRDIINSLVYRKDHSSIIPRFDSTPDYEENQLKDLIYGLENPDKNKKLVYFEQYILRV
jgi:hypothetical protein